MRTMRKLVILLSVVAVSFALQAGDGACSKDKSACSKSKVAAGETVKTGACTKTQVGACTKTQAGTCDKSKKAEEAAKTPAASPKSPS